MLDIFPSKSKDNDTYKGDSGTSAKSDNYLTSGFEIETDRIGEANLQDKLEKLADKGYIKVNEEESYKIFTPTWKTRWLRVNGIL